jgi:glycosyltransferase involved in cell wall biosynthesis
LKLSIIIPVYNEIECLERFTTSLVNSFKNEKVEYIFINDGSNDGSAEWLSNYINQSPSNINQSNNILINLPKNMGKGKALRKGLEVATGQYVLFQDSDLELDPQDSREMYDLIKQNPEMNILFGSRFTSGKLKANKKFINEIFVKVNSIIFNILFQQSISDLHCGTKIISKKVIDKIQLSINDFGIEIDIASQIAKNNFRIYEYGVSYYSRTKVQGKKVTWVDGVLSYFYLFKTRFIDNDISVLLSILYSILYMIFVGSYFGMGIGKMIVIIFFSILGSFIGLHKKLFTSSLVFLFIYFGSLFSKGNGKIYTVLIGFIIGMYISKIIYKKIHLATNNKLIKFFV